jgi:DNA-binding CsgD family transcriptional regulator
MKALSGRDFALVQRATLALYSHRDLESLRAAVPGIFLGLIRASYFSLGDAILDREKRALKVINIWESRPVRVGRLLEAFERNSPDHPFVRHALKHELGRALMLSDFMTLPQLRRTRFYQEALRPANIGRLLSIGSMSGPGFATLSLARPESDSDFTERDRHVLEILRPHFDQARANVERESLVRAGRTESLKARGMTARETEVALWLVQGKSNQEIAAILDGPVRTIEKHVERILRKMGVENRSSAAVAVAAILRG